MTSVTPLKAQACTSITITNVYGLPGTFRFFVLDSSLNVISSSQFKVAASNGSTNISLDNLLTVGSTYTAELEPYGRSGVGNGNAFSNYVMTVSPDLQFANGTNTFSGLVYAPASAEENFTYLGPAKCIFVSPTKLPPAQAGQAYLATMSASGGIGPPYTWSISSGALPAGFTLNQTSGAITSTGSPAAAAQVYNFTVQAADSAGDAGQQPIALTVSPGITITLTQPPANDQYAITATPTMPTIHATAAVVGVTPDPTPTTTFTWSATLKINENGGTGKTENYSNDIVQSQTTTGSGTYTLTFTDTADFLGGNLTLKAIAPVSGHTVTGSTPADLAIYGTNPQRSAIQSAIIAQVPTLTFSGLLNGDVEDAIQRIACLESGQTQFKANAGGGVGPPLVASDNGIGIMQITQAKPDLFVTNPDVVFDWPVNAGMGVTTYQTKVKSASPYPGMLRKDNNGTDPDSYQYYITNTINPARVAAGLMPITILPAPNFTIAGQIGSNPPDQLLEDGVRGYNGFSGTPVFNIAVLHEFVPNAAFLMTVPNSQLPTLSTNPAVWMRVCSEPGDGVLYGPAGSADCTAARGSSGDPSYVNDVAANTAQCPDGAQKN